MCQACNDNCYIPSMYIVYLYSYMMRGEQQRKIHKSGADMQNERRFVDICKVRKRVSYICEKMKMQMHAN